MRFRIFWADYQLLRPRKTKVLKHLTAVFSRLAFQKNCLALLESHYVRYLAN